MSICPTRPRRSSDASVASTQRRRAASSGAARPSSAIVRPGITVLVEDSLHLIRGKRIALLTNQTGVDANGVSDIELLRGEGAVAAGVRLVLLLAPEHGIRG